MKCLNKKSFELPFMGKDKFVRLTRIGLGYTGRSFYIKNYNNVEKIVDTLSDILDEKISFLQSCLLCEKEFLCSDCKNYNLCTTKDLPLQCICRDCIQSENSYDRYVKKVSPQSNLTNTLRARILR